MDNVKGFSFYICFGKYGGWRCCIDGPALRITLGWVGLAFMRVDLERFMGAVFKMLPPEQEASHE